MENIIANYVKVELMILVPVLWLIGDMIKKTKMSNRFIPLIVGVIGIFLAGLYVFSGLESYSAECVTQGIFASITQGVLCAGGSVYVHEMVKNMTRKDTSAQATAENIKNSVDKTP